MTTASAKGGDKIREILHAAQHPLANDHAATPNAADANDADGVGARPPEFSDEALALGFIARHADKLRYTAAWSTWHLWTGAVWRPDEVLKVIDLTRRECRRVSEECDNARVARSIASATTVFAVERLARADHRVASTVDGWDADPWALNTPDGVVGLQTGDVRPHDPRDHMTKITACGSVGECPVWRDFLSTVTGGDQDLAAFLQRIAGYALSGSTREHALFFLYGTGANGKSVFIDTLAGIMGGYHRTSPIETFTASSTDRHPADLAALRGARLVTAVETEEGRYWAESKIKALTGGDKIAARFMRQDFFEFTPAFKLLIAGNHKPRLRSVDEAIRRRFHMVPFAVTIPEGERDPDLKEKLQREWPGILQWAIDGCLDWQEYGLRPPQAVLDATAQYLAAEDAVATWLDECCTRDPNGWSSSSELFGSWEAWAKRSGEFVGTTRRLSQELETRGLVPLRKKKARGFQGVTINRLEYFDSRY